MRRADGVGGPHAEASRLRGFPENWHWRFQVRGRVWTAEHRPALDSPWSPDDKSSVCGGPQQSSHRADQPPRERPAATCTYLTAVFGDELVLLHRVFDENAPAGHVGRRQQQVLEDPAQAQSQEAAESSCCPTG